MFMKDAWVSVFRKFRIFRKSRAHNLTEISVILDFLPFFWDCARLITKSTYKIIFRKSQKKTWHPCRGPTLYLAGVQLFFLLWNTASKVQNFLQFNQICDKMCEFSAKSFNPKIFLRSLKISKNAHKFWSKWAKIINLKFVFMGQFLSFRNLTLSH